MAGWVVLPPQVRVPLPAVELNTTPPTIREGKLPILPLLPYLAYVFTCIMAKMAVFWASYLCNHWSLFCDVKVRTSLIAWRGKLWAHFGAYNYQYIALDTCVAVFSDDRGVYDVLLGLSCSY